MKKPRKGLLCLFVLTGLLIAWFGIACSGCSNQTGEANELISKFNKRINNFNKLDQEASVLMNKVNLEPESEEDYEKNITLLGQIETKVDQQLKELDEASKLLDKAKDLKISDDLKKYIGLEQEVNQANQELSGTAKEMAVELKNIYDSIKNDAPGLSQEELERKSQDIAALDKKLDTQKKKVEKLKQKAKTYYDEQNIGGK